MFEHDAGGVYMVVSGSGVCVIVATDEAAAVFDSKLLSEADAVDVGLKETGCPLMISDPRAPESIEEVLETERTSVAAAITGDGKV